MKPYEGHDGLKRNWIRHVYEWKVFRVHWKKQPKSHDPVTNFFVEMSRSVPWLAGHLWLYSLILTIGLAIAT